MFSKWRAIFWYTHIFGCIHGKPPIWISNLQIYIFQLKQVATKYFGSTWSTIMWNNSSVAWVWWSSKISTLLNFVVHCNYTCIDTLDRVFLGYFAYLDQPTLGVIKQPISPKFSCMRHLSNACSLKVSYDIFSIMLTNKFCGKC